MFLADVNVVVSAFRRDNAAYHVASGWLRNQLEDAAPFGYSEWVLAAFIRLCSNPRVFVDAAPTADVIRFAETIRESPNAHGVSPGPRHWGIFVDLCKGPGVRGDIIPDARLAALAIESGCQLATFDRGFGRFAGLRWHLLTV